MGAVKTLHVCGYKNSGKTTLISHWIGMLRARGIEVAVLKHHGHGGEPDLPPDHTDTVQFLQAGALSTVVAGGDMVQLVQQRELSFGELKTLAASGRPDILLVEGYKNEAGAKLVLLRDKNDDDLRSLPGVIHAEFSETLFSDRTALDDWLIAWVEDESNETI